MKFLLFTKELIQNYSFMGVIHRTLGDKGYILLLSIVVGVISGTAAVLLKLFAHGCHDLARLLAERLPWMMWILPVVPAIGIFGCIVIVRLFFNKGPYEKSLAGVIMATTNGTSDLPRSKTYSHIITSGLAVGMGASAGLEAPIALTGSAIGSNVAKVLQLGRESRTLLLACGGGAGISAIFNSPVAGALFACEILLPAFSVPALVPLLMASAAAAVISEMDEPLGFAVGNALEVIEAIDTLKGNGPKDLEDLCVALGSYMLVSAGKADSLEEAADKLRGTLKDGSAYEKMIEFVTAQGGSREDVENPQRLLHATYTDTITAPKTGYIAHIQSEEVGLAAMTAGGGRETKDSVIDLSAGIVLNKKVGDFVKENEPLARLYANDKVKLEAAKNRLAGAYSFSEEPVPARPLIHGVITEKDI